MTKINRRSALMLGAALIPAMSFADEMQHGWPDVPEA